MSTLLLRLAAPLQSWGLDNKFERRMTMREPTKSGVIGMLAAALGRRREEGEEAVKDLAPLRFGVRIDQPGQLLHDFHTAQGKTEKEKFVTHRYYLADAVFLVGLEGDDAFLQMLDEAINAPAFPLYLGRRSCPPAGRVSLGIRGKMLEDALREEPWQASWWRQKRELRLAEQIRLTLVLDSDGTGAVRRRDLPLSFNQAHRKYAFRNIADQADAVAISTAVIRADNMTEHDPFDSV